MNAVNAFANVVSAKYPKFPFHTKSGQNTVLYIIQSSSSLSSSSPYNISEE